MNSDTLTSTYTAPKQRRYINGHAHQLPAAGTDAARRRQYLYHERWRERRDREKFERMIRFAESLSAFRDVISSDLRPRGLEADTVLACAVRLHREERRAPDDLGFRPEGGFGHTASEAPAPDGGDELLVSRAGDRWKRVQSTDINRYIKR